MKNSLLVHKHLIIRAEADRPPTDEDQCNMPGNRGITAVAIIETSHIAMHIWDEPKPALMQFDVYSCGEFDVKEICDKIKEEFNVKKIEYKYLNRETGLVDI